MVLLKITLSIWKQILNGKELNMEDNRKLINDETIKQLVGKKVIFKLTDDEDDEGLIGTLKKYDDSLIIERDGLNLVIELYELYGIEEYNEVKYEE